LLVAGRIAAVNFDFDEDQEELRDTVRVFSSVPLARRTSAC